MTEDKTYIGSFIVFKVYRKSGKKEVISRGLTRSSAVKLVRSYPNSNTSMVVFDKEFTADKYYI